MNGVRAQLEMDAMALEPGGSIRMVCPFCGGGRAKEQSLVLSNTEDGALLFVCHRANCGASGRLGGGPVLRKPDRRIGVPRPLECSRVAVPDEVRQWLLENWCINKRSALYAGEWSWDTERARLIMEVRGPRGQLRGHISRKLDPEQSGPKVLTYKQTVEQPWLHWVHPMTYGKQMPLVVVEDIPSAHRLGVNGLTAVAALGTYLDEDALDEILAEGNPVFFAFDKDAVKKSQAYYDKVKMRVARAGWIALERDFKNCTDKEIRNCLNAALLPLS